MAMNVAIGPVHPHVKPSHGGESDIMKFYCTSNESAYGQHFAKFEPRIGQHKGAGYVPNNRPFIGYTGHLDEIDNPAMGKIVAGNYLSTTHKHFVGYGRPYGREELPSGTYYSPTGFVRDKGLHVPTALQVQKQFIDSRLRNAPHDVRPRHKTMLQRTLPKNPYAEENFGHGPGFMSTEYKVKYRGDQPERLNLDAYSIGPKENSGFTDNVKTVEPITFNPDSNHRNHRPGWMTDRPTRPTIYSIHYRGYGYPDGREPLPQLTPGSSREDGFTRCNYAVPDYVQLHPERVYDKAEDIGPARLDKLKRSDPTEYFNAIHPNPHSSIYKDTFKGEQGPPKTMADLLNRTDVGEKEHTGHTSNNDSHVQTRDDPSRFITYNMVKFYDPNPEGLDRMGHLNFNVDPVLPDAFSRSTSLHKIESQVEAMRILPSMEPYQARATINKERLPTAPTKMMTLN